MGEGLAATLASLGVQRCERGAAKATAGFADRSRSQETVTKMVPKCGKQRQTSYQKLRCWSETVLTKSSGAKKLATLTFDGCMVQNCCFWSSHGIYNLIGKPRLRPKWFDFELRGLSDLSKCVETSLRLCRAIKNLANFSFEGCIEQNSIFWRLQSVHDRLRGSRRPQNWFQKITWTPQQAITFEWN